MGADRAVPESGRYRLLHQVLEVAQDDWVPEAEIYSICMEVGDDLVPREDVRLAAVDLASRAMGDGLLVAGTLTHGGFEQWDVGAADAIERVRSAWLAPAEPIVDLGAVAWFDLTEAGKAWLDAER